MPANQGVKSDEKAVDPVGTLLIDERDLVGDFIGELTFSQTLFFLTSGRRPTASELVVFDTVISVLCAHGQMGSHESAVRMSSIPSDEAIQVSIAAGILGISKKILGSMQEAGELLTEFAQLTDGGKEASSVAEMIVKRSRATHTRLPGFGHTTFVGGDPRVPRLLAVASEQGVGGKHIAHVQEIERAIETELGRHLPLNVTGAVAALLLEVGLPWQLFRGFALISRISALTVHAAEERQSPMIPDPLHLASRPTAGD